MIKVDVRLKNSQMELLHSIVGKEIQSINHDQFTFVSSSSQIVQINAENGTFYLYSFTEPIDHFRSIEDVAIWSFETERYKAVDNKNFINTPFMEKVKTISVIQENQRLYQNGKQIYDVWLTRGLIFDFGEHQLSFEKAIWLSEEIYIRKGYNLIDDFAPTDSFIDSDWDKGITAECSREILELT